MTKRYRVTFSGCVNLAGSETELDEIEFDELPSDATMSEHAYDLATDYFEVEGWYVVEEIEA